MCPSEGFGDLQKVSEKEDILPGGIGIRPKAWGGAVGVGKGLWAPKSQKTEHGLSWKVGEALGQG